MTIHIEKYPDEPIIFVSMVEPMDYYQEVPDMFTRILELRDTIEGYSRYYVIMDMTGIKPNFSEIVFSLSHARKASQKRRSEFPMVLNLVGAGELFELVANALAQAQYGEYTAPLQTSVEKALAAVRADIEKN